ncbi:MAG TPA: NAD(P)-binding protein, partial [Polyangia bacterium]|nr:NAD(P)-binding protein [Polyangia bacterium]
MRIGVLGGGAWGTVLASLAAARGHDVALWELDTGDAKALASTRASARTVPGFRLPASVTVTNNVGAAVRGRELVVV